MAHDEHDHESSHVLAATFHVRTPERWRADIRANREALTRLGAHHVVVYQALDDPDQVFVTIGVHHRGSLESLLQSGAVLAWFDAAGVEEIPPVFAGDVVEKLDLDDGVRRSTERGILVAAIAPVPDLAAFMTRLHAERDALRSEGVRQVWTYRALDDGHEVMILQDVGAPDEPTPALRHVDTLREWMDGAGVGVYPDPFVGRLSEVFEYEVHVADPDGE